MSLDSWIDLNDNLSVFEHQIAGHGMVYEKQGKLLRLDNKIILKPLQTFPKGLVELEFYQRVFHPNCTDASLLELRNFIPRYYGLYRASVENSQTFYIGLENILAPMKRPTVIDLKIGRISYVPGASQEKMVCEVAKYRYREEIGFLVTGIKYFDRKSNDYVFLDRFFGRSLDVEDVYHKGILFFLGEDLAKRQQLAQQILLQLYKFQLVMSRQISFCTYASSLLIAYDSGLEVEESANHCPCNHHHHEDSAQISSSTTTTTVKWIDFTHVIPQTGRDSDPLSVDDNFLFGLTNLIGLFERVLRESSLVTAAGT